MILLVDAGNSRLKWAEFTVGQLRDQEPVSYQDSDPAEVFKKTLDGPIKLAKRLIVSSVLGEKYCTVIGEWVRLNHGIQVEFVNTEKSACGVTVAYQEPRQMGVDRFVALIAARAEYSTHCIIIDCGTAITIDALADNGEHYGGTILPGPELMSSSLSMRTQGINNLQQEVPVLFGTSTNEAVSGGIHRTVVAAINQITRDMSLKMDGKVTKILCGGSAQPLQPYLDPEMVFEPQLILKGLAVIASANS